MVYILKTRSPSFGIPSYANSYSSTVSKNIELERHKKTALKHSSSMNECATQKLWR